MVSQQKFALSVNTLMMWLTSAYHYLYGKAKTGTCIFISSSCTTCFIKVFTSGLNESHLLCA